MGATVCSLLICSWTAAAPAPMPENVAVAEFGLRQPFPPDAPWGGLFAHDLTGDGRMDFVVSSEGHLGAYDQSGKPLWLWRGPIRLFEYAHHPSAIAGDLDGDGRQEVAFLNDVHEIVVLDGSTGDPKNVLRGLGEPVAMAVANLRGAGDRDIVLQYDLTRLRAVRGEDGQTLWETAEYKAIEHSPLRMADLDGDGRDEVAGAALIDHDGKRMNEWELDGHHEWMDSIAIADIVSGGPLEVALAEQRGGESHTDVVNADRIVWRTLNPWNWEDPDKLVVGDFDPERPGLEVFNRSSGGDGTAKRGDEEPYASEEAPWVLDSRGELIAKYYVNDRKPEWWTGHGIEEIHRIDWDGDNRDELAAKERHKVGAAAILDAVSGEFRVIFPVEAVRLYAADVKGDSREEVIVLDAAGIVKVIENTAENVHPKKPSPWTRNPYRRQKQNWDYYSP